MALYTLKNRDEVMNSLANYNGNDTWVRNQLASFGYSPSAEQTQMYNTLGRDAGASAGSVESDNFFTKRAKSVENALGTTGAALYESGGNLLGAALAGLTGGDYTSAVSARQNAKTDQLLKDAKASMNDIAKKYGYNTWSDWQDAYYNAKDAGDETKVADMDKQLLEFQAQANANVDAANKNAAEYRDYVENNDVSKRINQDRGKFLGSAINTLSTATDLLGLTNGPIANAIQGGVEGIADELEQNGLNNFDWNRAGQNALVGAASGAATGMLNNAIDSRLAGKGGNFFKGNNALTNGINNFNQNTKLGQVASTIGSGVARGAQSGAVGGAVGAGLSSALNGAEVGQGIANAIQGGVQGAQQGAFAGGTMAGANMLINKTPGVNRFMQKVNEAKQDWQNSGDNFSERLNNTRANNDTWGNRFLNNRIEDARAVKQGFKDVGEGLGVLAERSGRKDLAAATPSDLVNAMRGKGNEVVLQEALKNPGLRNRFIDTADDTVTTRYNDERRPDIAQALQNGVDNNMDGFLMRQKLYEDGNNTRLAEGKTPWNSRQTILEAERTGQYKGGQQGHYMRHADEMGGANGITDAMYRTFSGEDSVAYPTSQNANTMLLNKEANNGYPASTIVDENGVVRSISPRNDRQVARYEQQKSDLGGGNRSTIASVDTEGSGFPFSARQVDDSILPQTQSEVKVAPQEMPQDIQNMRINDGNQSPETAVYRALTGETSQPSGDLMYGESNLGNRTKRGMLADSLERFGNTLEGAQTNVTRAATKDLGIESTGKVVENVRKKTGITNLETQAALAKELTGGDNSLMDSIQRRALSASEDGTPYKVDTDPVLKDVDSIVDKYADTNMFGSQTARDRFVSNLRRDISNYDSDILSIANRMKSNAADLRGRGVASPTPADSAKAKIYTEVANRLDDLSYKAIPQENVDAMFDATISEMRGRAKQASGNGNKDIARAYNQLADSLDSEPRTVQAFRSFKKDFVDISKINELTARAENGAATQMGRDLGGSLRKFSGALLQRPINATLAKAGGAINSLADKVGGNATATPAVKTSATSADYNPATQVYNAIGRTTGEIEGEDTASKYLNAASQEGGATSIQGNEPATLDSLASNASPASATSVYNSLYGNNYASGDYYSNLLQRAMSMAMEDGNANAFASLLSMYNDYSQKNSKNSNSVANWNASDRSSYLKAQNGLSQIRSLEQAYNNAVGEGGSNGVQGTLRQLANNISFGNLDPSAENYVKQANSIGAGIIKNLVNLGSTEYDAERYIDYLPKLTDTKEQAKQKLETLYNAYEDILNNLYAVYGF